MFDNFDMGMPLGEKLVFALQVSLFGILMVFLLLIILAVLIMIISRVVRLGENLAGKKGKKNAASDEPAPVQQSAAAGTPLPGTQSQGTLELDGVTPRPPARGAPATLGALPSRPPRLSWL